MTVVLAKLLYALLVALLGAVWILLWAWIRPHDL